MQLPANACDWLQSETTQELVRAFQAANRDLRFVGGCVRDALMGYPVRDMDCATTAQPQEVMALLQQAGIEAVPTGIRHGTVTAVLQGKPYEITTLRRDVACDGRHAEVAFTDRWEEDAKRRDFTLNALYCDENGKIFDYVGGIEAAQQGRIEFIGAADGRIREDGLRILRFFRFYATHGKAPADEAALQACQRHRQMLDGLSGERIWQEMRKLFAAPDPVEALMLMETYGITTQLLADHKPAAAQLQPIIAAGITEAQDPVWRLGAYLRYAQANAKSVVERWKCSKKDSARLLRISELKMDSIKWPENATDIDHGLYHAGREAYIDALLLKLMKHETVADDAVMHWFRLARSREIPLFPMQGKDLSETGIKPGPQMGQCLKHLRQYWQQHDFQPNKHALLAVAKQWLEEH